MNEILLFIVEHLSFLYYEYGFKFVDSSYERGNAYLRLSSGELDIAFTRAKAQMSLDFISKYDKSKYNWISIELIRKMINSNEEWYSSLLNESNGIFLKQNFEKILKYFTKKNINKTLKIVKELKKERSEYMDTHNIFDFEDESSNPLRKKSNE